MHIAKAVIRSSASALAVVIVATAAAAAAAAEGPLVEEVRFGSGPYELVGDLVLPDGPGPHPAVIVVPGSGPNTRTQMPGYWDVRERFGKAGFAVFSWDKPGSGESTGELIADVLTNRAAILADGMATLAARPEIDAERIGLWGLSQGGWVMPMAIEQGAEAAFMVVVSGGAEDSIDQGMYQVGQRLVCNGAPPELGAQTKEIGSRAFKATTYEAYLAAVEEALRIPGIEAVYPVEVVPEQEWAPMPRELESFFDPMDVVERLDLPILAVFGELDRYIDPLQGAEAYAAAFDQAGNEHGRVELLKGVGHTMLAQVTGCPGESGGGTSARYLERLDEFIDDLARRG